MNKAQKRLTSSALAAASVFSVAAPAFAAEAVDVEVLVQNALNTKNFSEFNIALGEVMKLEKTEPTKYAELLAKLDTLTSIVYTEEVKELNALVDKIAYELSGRAYDEFEAAVNASKTLSEVDKGYYLGELTRWGRQHVWTADYVAAMDAVGALWTNIDKAGVDAAKAAVAKLTGDNAKYVQELLDEVVEAKNFQSLAVESVKVATAKSLTVKFNSAIEDTTKVVFDVVRGTTTKTTVAGLTVAWNDAKTEATLSSDVNLAANTYTVTVSGVEFAEKSNTGLAVVEAQKVADIQFGSVDLVKNSAGTAATFTYKVYDQYGTDITKTTSSASFATSAVVGTSTVTPSLDPSKGVGTVTHPFATTDKTAVITLVNKANGVNKTETFNVAAAVTVQDMVFGTNVLPSGKVNIEAGLASAVKTPVTVTDQYGNVVKDLPTLSGAINLISSNSSVTFAFVSDADGNPQIEMNTSGLTDKATVVLTAINPTTGKAWTNTFSVVKAAAPHSIEFGEFSKATIAAGDQDIVLPVTVYDQFGNQLTADQVVSNRVAIAGWITGNSHVTALTIENDRNSANYGKFVFDATTKGTDVLVVNTPAGVSTKNVEVKDARIVTTVSNIADLTLLQGAETDLKFVIKDQYGDVIKNSDLAAAHTNSDLTYKVEITKVSGDDNGISITTPALTGGTEESLSAVHVVAAGSKTGSYKVTVSLLDNNSMAVSAASTTVSVAKNNVAGIEYSVADVPVLNGSVNNTGTIDSTNVYAQKLVVTAKDANGVTYVINKDDIVDVVSSNLAVVKAGKDATATSNAKNWYVAGNDVATGNTTLANKTATLTIKINTLDGIKTVTKEVTVSPAVAAIQELRVVDSALANPTKDVSAKTDKLTYEFATEAAAVTGQTLNVIGRDQYGVWTNRTTATTIVNSTNYAPSNSFTFTGSTLAEVAGSRASVTAGKDLKITLTEENGSVQVTVKIVAGDTLVLNEAATPDATFTLDSSNFGYALVVGDIDMDSATAGVQNTVTINGVAYTVAVATGTATVTGVGNATAAAAATTATITVKHVGTGASDTVKLNIAAATAGAPTTFTITE